MNADAFRHVYDYHISSNREIWDKHIIPLTQDQFTQKVSYSIGSVRNHVVHMLDVDRVWFGDLRGDDVEGFKNPAQWIDRDKIRAEWDTIEAMMRDYLATLNDDMLTTQPLSGEDENLYLWQILWHVANHGTDHRAQLLRILHDLGQDTRAQDYVFYVYDNP